MLGLSALDQKRIEITGEAHLPHRRLARAGATGQSRAPDRPLHGRTRAERSFEQRFGWRSIVQFRTGCSRPLHPVTKRLRGSHSVHRGAGEFNSHVRLAAHDVCVEAGGFPLMNILSCELFTVGVKATQATLQSSAVANWSSSFCLAGSDTGAVTRPDWAFSRRRFRQLLADLLARCLRCESVTGTDLLRFRPLPTYLQPGYPRPARVASQTGTSRFHQIVVALSLRSLWTSARRFANASLLVRICLWPARVQCTTQRLPRQVWALRSGMVVLSIQHPAQRGRGFQLDLLEHR